jgi:site-specific recombinase XerD
LEYEDYLRTQRGLSEKSVYDCWRFADRFLEFRFNGKRRDLSKIAPVDIARFMQHLISRGKPFRDKTPPTHLRNFFQFLFKSGRTNANLAPSVPRIAQRYASRLPRHLTPEQVETVVAAVKADTALGRRNYAMMLLMARLGLRAAEVIAIQIDDIDWRVGEFAARGNCMIACRFRGMSVKRSPITSGRIVSQHPARCSFGIVCRTCSSPTRRS